MRILPVLLCLLAMPLAGCGSSPDTTTNMDTGATIVAGGNNRLTLGSIPISGTPPWTLWPSCRCRAPILWRGGDHRLVCGAQRSRRALKVTIYILDRALRADGLKVVVFRQVRAAGNWSDSQPSPDTAHRLEDAILTRARELRLATLGSGYIILSAPAIRPGAPSRRT